MSEDTTAKRAGRRRRTTRGGRRRSLRVPGAPLRDSWPVGAEAAAGEDAPAIADEELESELDAELENAPTDEFGAMKVELADGIDDTGKTAEMHVQFPPPPIPDDEKTQPRYRLDDRFESFESGPIDQDSDELTNPRIRVAGLGAFVDSEEPESQPVVVRSSVVIAPSRIIGVSAPQEDDDRPQPAPRPSAPPRDSLPAGVGSSQSRPPPRLELPPSSPAPSASASAYAGTSVATANLPVPPSPRLPLSAPAPASVPPAANVPPPPSLPLPPSVPTLAGAVAPAVARVPNVSPLSLNVPTAPALDTDAPALSEPDDAELMDVEEAEPVEPVPDRRELRSPPPPPPPAPALRVAPPVPPLVGAVPAVPAVSPPPVPAISTPAAVAPAAAAPAVPATAKRPPPPPSAAKVDEDRQKRKQARQWWERFFSDDYLATVLPPTPAQIAQQIDFVEASLGLQKGGSVLDVGCGLGLHAIELARRGYLVVAIDLSLAMITRAAEAAQQQNLKVSFIHADIREMEFDGAFDAVICLGTTFGFFDDEANRDVLSRMQHGLKPGGRLLIDVVNRDYVIKAQPNLVWFEGDECVCMEESEFNYFNSRLSVKRTMMREDGRQTNAEYSMRLYSLHELGQLVQTMGFRVIEVSGQEATRGTFFGSYAPRILLLAERRSPAGARPPGTMPFERASTEMTRPSFAMSPLGSSGGSEGPTRPSAAFPAERPGTDATKPPKPE